MVKPASRALTALFLAAAACGGSGGGTTVTETVVPDCAWFVEGPNCWTEAAATAVACASPAAVGSFDEATTSCSYGDGTTVVFEPSASASTVLNQGGGWRFTIATQAGATCARYVETDTAQTLWTGRGEATFSWDTAHPRLTCPDGNTFVPPQGVGCGFGGAVLVLDGTVMFFIPATDLSQPLWQCR